MKKMFQKIFAEKAAKDTFGDFFLRTPPAEQVKVLRDVARKANEDQQTRIRAYEKLPLKPPLKGGFFGAVYAWPFLGRDH